MASLCVSGFGLSLELARNAPIAYLGTTYLIDDKENPVKNKNYKQSPNKSTIGVKITDIKAPIFVDLVYQASVTEDDDA